MQQIEDTKTVALTLPQQTPTPDEQGKMTLVRLEDIEALPQVRTESGMDDQSLDELGNSITKQGLLQPPLLRRQEGKTALAIVAGHRRIAAMRRAGYESCYAIVGNTDEANAYEMQLAENIHREQLSPLEIGNSVAFLLAKHKTLANVATIVKKSKPWVSKHLAVTLPNFSKVAKDMLKSGECEDLEILGIINQLDKMGCHDDIQALRNNPPLTRAKAKAALKLAKAEETSEDEGADEGADEAESEGKEERTAPTPEDEQDEILSDMITMAVNHSRELVMTVDRARAAIAHLAGALKVNNPKASKAMDTLSDLIAPK